MKHLISLERLASTYNLPVALAKYAASVSNGDGVRAINKLVGNSIASAPTELKAQYEIIHDEVLELLANLESRNYAGIRDDIADIKFTAEGMAARMGMLETDLDEIEVVLSNLSKFDTNEQDALATKAKYEKIGVETEYVNVSFAFILPTDADPGEESYSLDLFVTRSTKLQYGLDGKKYNAGKWLKSINFVEPNYRNRGFSYVDHEAEVETEAAEPGVEACEYMVQFTFSGCGIIRLLGQAPFPLTEFDHTGAVHGLDRVKHLAVDWLKNLVFEYLVEDAEHSPETVAANMNDLLAEIANLDAVSIKDAGYWHFNGHHVDISIVDVASATVNRLLGDVFEDVDPSNITEIGYGSFDLSPDAGTSECEVGCGSDTPTQEYLDEPQDQEPNKIH